MDPEADKPEPRTLLDSWWQLPPLMRVWLPVSTVLSVMPLLSISEYVVDLHGFVVELVAFYAGLRDPFVALIFRFLGVSVPVPAADAVVLYLLVTGVFARTVGFENYPWRLIGARWAARLIEALAAAPSIALRLAAGLLLVGSPIALIGVGLLLVDVLSCTLELPLETGAESYLVLLVIAAAILAAPAWSLLRNHQRGIQKRAALFYSSLVATLLLFGVLAGVSAGLSQIQ